MTNTECVSEQPTSLGTCQVAAWTLRWGFNCVLPIPLLWGGKHDGAHLFEGLLGCGLDLGGGNQE